MKNVLSVAISVMAVAVIVGCGSQQPAQTAKPAEPAFVAQAMNLPAMKVASIAKMGPYSDAGKAMSDLMATVEQEKLTVKGPPYGMYFDDPATAKPESTRYEIRVPVDSESKNSADKKTGFAVKDAPAMTVAVTDYMGPYDQVAPTYEKLNKWVAENNFEPAGAMIEWYLSDPSQVKPESLQAKIGLAINPVAPPDGKFEQGEEPKRVEPEAPTGE
jgi:effector-binding domain-containing protein